MDKKKKPLCELCGGQKYLRVEPKSKIKGIIVPGGAFVPCPCTYVERTFRNIEKGWKNLFLAPTLKGSSPLLECTESNVWVTAPVRDFRAHLKHVSIRKGPTWDFKVVSDKTLMTADFANISIKGIEILDPDFEDVEKMASKSLEVLTLSDLIEPPELLIIQLGVKGRNRHLPEVLFETLSQREHLFKKTWIWDQPNRPFSENHHGYSSDLASFIEIWEHERIKIGSMGQVLKMQGEFGMEGDGEEDGEESIPSGFLSQTALNSSAKAIPDERKPKKRTQASKKRKG